MVEYPRLAVTVFAMILTVYLARNRCSSRGCQVGMFAGTTAFALLLLDELIVKVYRLSLLGELILTILVTTLLLIFFIQAIRNYSELQ